MAQKEPKGCLAIYAGANPGMGREWGVAAEHGIPERRREESTAPWMGMSGTPRLENYMLARIRQIPLSHHTKRAEPDVFRGVRRRSRRRNDARGSEGGGEDL